LIIYNKDPVEKKLYNGLQLYGNNLLTKLLNDIADHQNKL